MAGVASEGVIDDAFFLTPDNSRVSGRDGPPSHEVWNVRGVGAPQTALDMNASESDAPSGQERDGSTVQQSDGFGTWRCRFCGTLRAVENRPERCFHCRRGEHELGERRLFEPFELRQQASVGREQTTKELAAEWWSVEEPESRTRGEWAELLDAQPAYVDSLRRAWREGEL